MPQRGRRVAGRAESPELLGGGRQLPHAHEGINGLAGRQMVAHGADAAEALHQHRHLPVRTPLNELLKPAELDDVQPHLMHAAVLVEENGDFAVSLDPRHGVNGDAAQRT